MTEAPPSTDPDNKPPKYAKCGDGVRCDDGTVCAPLRPSMAPAALNTESQRPDWTLGDGSTLSDDLTIGPVAEDKAP